MRLSQLIMQLKRLKKEHGDLPVRYQSLTHRWEPEPTVTKTNSDTLFVLLNP